jgi:hypothetical protein
MNYTAQIKNITLDYTDKKPLVTLKLDNIAGIEELKDKKLSVELKQHREKRSLDINAYCWVLCQALAEKMNISKEEVYRMVIKEIGVCEITPIRNEAVKTWINNWTSKGIGWLCEILGESKLKGYTNVINYYGTSCYDNKDMSRLVNSLVEDCKLQGIPTKEDLEINKMLESWGK